MMKSLVMHEPCQQHLAFAIDLWHAVMSGLLLSTPQGQLLRLPIGQEMIIGRNHVRRNTQDDAAPPLDVCVSR